jgi:hypothetical protein
MVARLKARIVQKDSTSSRALPKSGWEREFTFDPWGTIGENHDNCYDYAFGSFSSTRPIKSAPGNRANMSSNGMNYRSCDGIVKRVLADNPGSVYKMRDPNSKPRPGFYKVMCFVAPSNNFGNSYGDFHWYVQMGSVRYKVRLGDTVAKLAKFFHVRPAVISASALKPLKPLSNTDGKIAENNSALRMLAARNIRGAPRLVPGKILRFKVNLWSHKRGWGEGPLMIDAKGRTIVDPRKSERKWHPGFHYTRFCSAYGVRRGAANTGNKNR